MNSDLIVKNFGPIKNVELELKKINVLIGEQGSGKSTIARIVSFCMDEYLLINPTSSRELQTKLSLDHLITHNSFIRFKTELFSLTVKDKKVTTSINKEYKSLVIAIRKAFRHYAIEDKISWKKEFDALFSKFIDMFGFITYIPAERILISLVSDTPIAFLNNVKLPTYLLEFAEKYEQAKESVRQKEFSFLNNHTFSTENKTDYLYVNDKSKIKLIQAASGFQSVVPFLVYMEYAKETPTIPERFIIEEPESNLFPATQYDVVKYLVELLNIKNRSALITTHSPYILSSFNNLMYAQMVGETNTKSVNKIISKKFWLNPKDLSAYMFFNNGNYENIMDKEEGMIKIEKIDEISRVLNSEFDSIQKIYFAKKK